MRKVTGLAVLCLLFVSLACSRHSGQEKRLSDVESPASSEDDLFDQIAPDQKESIVLPSGEILETEQIYNNFACSFYTEAVPVFADREGLEQKSSGHMVFPLEYSTKDSDWVYVLVTEKGETAYSTGWARMADFPPLDKDFLFPDAAATLSDCFGWIKREGPRTVIRNDYINIVLLDLRESRYFVTWRYPESLFAVTRYDSSSSIITSIKYYNAFTGNSTEGFMHATKPVPSTGCQIIGCVRLSSLLEDDGIERGEVLLYSNTENGFELLAGAPFEYPVSVVNDRNLLLENINSMTWDDENTFRIVMEDFRNFVMYRNEEGEWILFHGEPPEGQS